jgi:hypothetical protein
MIPLRTVPVQIKRRFNTMKVVFAMFSCYIG